MYSILFEQIGTRRLCRPIIFLCVCVRVCLCVWVVAWMMSRNVFDLYCMKIFVWIRNDLVGGRALIELICGLYYFTVGGSITVHACVMATMSYFWAVDVLLVYVNKTHTHSQRNKMKRRKEIFLPLLFIVIGIPGCVTKDGNRMK